MFRFADLLKGKLPVLVFFHSPSNQESNEMDQILQLIGNDLANKVKIVRIDTLKNESLCHALRVKYVPTMLLYKEDMLIWRQSKVIDSNTLCRVINILLE